MIIVLFILLGLLGVVLYAVWFLLNRKIDQLAEFVFQNPPQEEPEEKPKRPERYDPEIVDYNQGVLNAIRNK